MAATPETAPLSDTETSEKPVREQLKKASLAGMAENADASVVAEEPAENGNSRGRLQRKRSFEDVDGDQAEQTTSEPLRLHTRKRSRDSTAEEDALYAGKRKVSGERSVEAADAAQGAGSTNGEGSVAGTDERPRTPEVTGEKSTEVAAEGITSPKTKRSRLHSTAVDENSILAAEQPAIDVPDASANVSSAEASAQPTEPMPTSAETTTTKVPPTSGFANTSATSPFGALSGSKSPTADQPQTAPSAFAASAFGSLSASSTSGFGAIGKTTGGFGAGGGFATGGKSPLGGEASKENEKPKEASSSAFGGALGQKSAFAAPPASAGGFGSASSGFGKLGGSGAGFGGALGSSGFGGLGGASSGGLSSFASGKPSSALAGSSKAAKGFGAPADDEEDGEDNPSEDDAGFKSPLAQEEDKQDERFYEQQLETGEEDEETEYSCRAKLYNYALREDGKKEWRERGLGILRLNVSKPAPDDPEGKLKARFLMRADGSHRVVLNTPVKKEISFGAAGGGAPQSGLMLFMGTIDGVMGLELLQLKVSLLTCSLTRFVYERDADICGRYGSNLRLSSMRKWWSCRTRCE